MKHIEGVSSGSWSSIPPLQSDDGALVSDPAGKTALLCVFLVGSSLEMLTVLFPVFASPRLYFCL